MTPKTYEINFDGQLKCVIKVTEDNIEVVAAMNRRGDAIDLKEITIEPQFK